MKTRSLLAICFCALFSSKAFGQKPKIISYAVQPGDTCELIALKLYGDKKLAKVLHQHNNLGAEPHELKRGQKLIGVKLPSIATITKKNGEVSVQAPYEDIHRQGAAGTELYLGWRVSTSALSSAEITLSDGSRVTLQGGTEVVVYGNDWLAMTLRKDNVQLELFDGSLRSTKQKAQLKVATPTAKVRLGAGDTLLSASQDGATRVIHYAGAAPIVAGEGSDEKLSLTEGTGTTIAPGQAPSAPAKLLKAPTWSPMNVNLSLIPTGDSGDIRGSWDGVSGAESYWVEIARDTKGDELVQRLYVSNGDSAFEASGLPLGIYHARLLSLDAAQLVSEPSAWTTFHIEAPSLYLQDGTPTRGDQLTIGGYFTAPAGYKCAQREFESPKERLSFTETGSFVIECSNKRGDKLQPVPVTVAEASIRVLGAAKTRVARETPTTLTLAVSGSFDESLRIQPEIFAETTPLQRQEDGTWQTTVTAKSNAPTEVTLRFLSGSEKKPLTVGTMRLFIEEPPPYTPATPLPEEPIRKPKPKISVGVLSGVSRTKGVALDAAKMSPVFTGMRIGLGAEFVALESEFKFSLPSKGGDAEFNGAVQARLMTTSKGTSAFLVIGGGGEVAGNSDLIGFFCSGVGLAYESPKGVGVRVDLRGVYLTRSDAYENTFSESSLGFFVRR